MANSPSAVSKGKGRADGNSAASSSALPPPPRPRTPPQPPARQLLCATPSSSGFPSPSSSKRKRQTRIDAYFGSKKLRISPLVFELSPEEKKQQQADIKALIKDIEQEEREAKKDERRAQQQLKRETQAAAARERQKEARHRANWDNWCARNAKPDATFELPKDLKRGDLWVLHRSITMCEKEFGLRRTEVFCLEHSCMPNWRTEGATDITLFRMDDVQTLAWRKEAMLAGTECENEEDLIVEGRRLFLQKQIAKTAVKESSAAHPGS